MRTTPFILASFSLLTLAACVTVDTADQNQDGAMEAMPHVTISWRIEDKGTDEFGMETSTVSLAVRTSADDVENVLLGDYVGCGEEAMPADGALLTLTCWWAGGGDEFQVRMDGVNTLIVSHRGLDEMTDIPEFTDKETIEIPTGSLVMTAKMEKI